MEEFAAIGSEVTGNEEFEEVTDGGELRRGGDMPGAEDLDETVAYEFADEKEWKDGLHNLFSQGDITDAPHLSPVRGRDNCPEWIFNQVK